MTKTPLETPEESDFQMIQLFSFLLYTPFQINHWESDYLLKNYSRIIYVVCSNEDGIAATWTANATATACQTI